MHTLRAAAALLANTRLPDALTALAVRLGFAAPARPLDSDICHSLGLGPSDTAHVVCGPGCRRALLVSIGASSPGPRDTIARTAACLARRTPHLEWLAIVAERSGPQLALAAWSAERMPPRIAALVIDRDHVVDSDAETMCAIAAAIDDSVADDPSTYARWLVILGRDGLSARFYRALERSVTALAVSGIEQRAARRVNDDDRRELALLHTTRLLFLAFLEAKGWLDGDRGFLARSYARCVSGRGEYHRRVLRPLFFGTLNTPPGKRAPVAHAFGRVPFLNGGLFAPTPLERRHGTVHFPDEAFGRLFADCFERYRFTAREDRRTWSEAAVDPEMLGRAFESLMAATPRHASGTYYTPHVLVSHLTESALMHALTGAPPASTDAIAALLRGERVAIEPAHAIRERIALVRILDPACGSGAFLVHTLERLSDLLRQTGDTRGLSTIRRHVLTRSIFGVDSNPTAVWLCELRLWLSVVLESDETNPERVRPLPNLDRHVRIGDALAGQGFETDADGPTALAAGRAGRAMATLRTRYARAVGPRKRTALRALEQAERGQAIALAARTLGRVSHERRDLLAAVRSHDLFGGPAPVARSARDRLTALRMAGRALRRRIQAFRAGAALPFAFGTGFADAQASGGFDIVLGNPPWVRQHAVPAAVRPELRHRFRAARDAAWARGALSSRAGRGFAGQVDLGAIFVERSVSLCRPDGVVALLLSAKLWRALAGGGVRQLLIDTCELLLLEDWAEADRTFNATVYPSLLVARRRGVVAPASVADTESAPGLAFESAP